MGGRKPPRRVHPWEAEAARTAAETQTKNTHRDPEPLLIVFDKPPLDTDQFILVHPNGKQTVHKVEKLIEVGDADKHVAIEVKGIPAVRDAKDRYALVQKRSGKSLHLVFQKVNGPLITMAGEDEPKGRRKQYHALKYEPPKPKDKDLRATPVDYTKVVAEEPHPA